MAIKDAEKHCFISELTLILNLSLSVEKSRASDLFHFEEYWKMIKMPYEIFLLLKRNFLAIMLLTTSVP